MPPSPPLSLPLGASQLDCEGPWAFSPPPGVQRWPCCAPPSKHSEILLMLGLGLARG
jgi:hypothetical protein